ncbi:MAG: Holliday junction branch migration protein RuvA [Deltaproteobacteria bacterium]|jgi:Holliday junction DNA helicase RuvA|nr:Holliday junction branch migration protein RuvA [Deltaproteobacteria bacterium]
MISCLKGELFQKSQEKATLLVNGVGYEVFLSSASVEKLPQLGEEAFLYTYTHVREDALHLFGFADTDEKQMFLLLINVSGVGPKLALAILSGIRPADLARAIATKDIARLTGLSGVGKKTAERLCLDLKDKVGVIAGTAEEIPDFGAASQVEGGKEKDVISALVNLGYPQSRANIALAAMKRRFTPESLAEMPLQELIRETLRSLA